MKATRATLTSVIRGSRAVKRQTRKGRLAYMRARKTIKDKSKKAYEDYVPEGVRAAIEANLVPGTSVRPVTEDDYYEHEVQKNIRPLGKEEYLLNVPDAAHLDDGKAKDSFAELFVPKWNSGEA